MTSRRLISLAVYCGDLDRCYLLPERTGRQAQGDLSLRVRPDARNGQRACAKLMRHEYRVSRGCSSAGRARRHGSTRSGVRAPSAPLPLRLGRASAAHEFRNHFGSLPRAAPRAGMRSRSVAAAGRTHDSFQRSTPDGHLTQVPPPGAAVRVGDLRCSPTAHRSHACGGSPPERSIPTRSSIRGCASSRTARTPTFTRRARRRPTAPERIPAPGPPAGATRAPRRLACRHTVRTAAGSTALRADTGLLVPEPVHTRDGELDCHGLVRRRAGAAHLLAAALDERQDPHRFAAARCTYDRLGSAMARLHNHADGWTPPADFVRIRWDWEAFFGDTMVVRRRSSAARVLGPGPGGLAASFYSVTFVSKSATTSSATARRCRSARSTPTWISSTCSSWAGPAPCIDLRRLRHRLRLDQIAVALLELRRRRRLRGAPDALIAGLTQHSAAVGRRAR